MGQRQISGRTWLEGIAIGQGQGRSPRASFSQGPLARAKDRQISRPRAIAIGQGQGRPFRQWLRPHVRAVTGSGGQPRTRIANLTSFCYLEVTKYRL